MRRATVLGLCWLAGCGQAPSERAPAPSSPIAGGAGGGAGSALAGATGGTGGAALAAGGTSGASPGGYAGTSPAASGGASGSGGSAGQGGGGGTMDTSSGCEAHSYVLCEDFEHTDAGNIPEGWSKHGDAAGVDDQEARHGNRSLKLGAIPSWERRIYHDSEALGSSHYGRIFYRVALPVPDAFVHSTLVAFAGSGPNVGPAEFRVVDTVKQAVDTPDVASRHQFLYNVQPQNSGEFGTGTSYDWYFDGEWHCAEWFVDADTQTYRFWFDGSQELEIVNGAGDYSGTELPQSFGEVRVGFINYQEAAPGFTAWIDDVALDHERIGCSD